VAAAQTKLRDEDVGGKAKAKTEGFDSNRELFGAYLVDDESRQAAMDFARQRGWPTGDVARGGLPGALRTLSIAPPPRFMVIDVGTALDYEEVNEGLTEIVRSGSHVVALGERNDVQLYRRVLEAGAADYLVKPIDAVALNAAFAKLEGPANAVGQRGRSIAIVGARGGIGTSSIAANCAWILAETLRRKVLLVDYDLHFGTLALLLDVQPTNGLAEALIDPDRVDHVFLDNAAVRLGKQLHLLASEQNVESARVGDVNGSKTFFQATAKAGDIGLVALPRHIVAQQAGIFELFDEVVIVTDASLAGLRDACRLLRLVRARHEKTKPHIVLNNRDAKPEVTRKEMEKGLEAPIDVELAYARDVILRCELAGEPLARAMPDHAIVGELSRLAVQLAGVREARPRTLLQRLLKR
jgi:pilus assembly protein CpaE